MGIILFKFYFSTSFFELLLQTFSFSLRKSFLNCARSTVYEFLSFLQAKTCKFLNEFNNCELACTS